MGPPSKVTTAGREPKVWDVEVKCGKTVRVFPEEGKVIHIALATFKRVPNERTPDLIHLMLKVDDTTVIMGSLSTENIHHMTCHLMIDREFELSHTWKNGSVLFYGHSVPFLCEDEDDEDDGDDGVKSSSNSEVGSNKKGPSESAAEKPVSVKKASQKKRPSEAPTTKPVPAKKARLGAPQKETGYEDGKKGSGQVVEAPPQLSKLKTKVKSKKLSSKAVG